MFYVRLSIKEHKSKNYALFLCQVLRNIIYLCIFELSILNTQKLNDMTKVTITKIANMAFLNFFNSKEVYSIQGFDSVRKASNFAKKWGYEVFESLPVGIAQYNQNNQ